MALQDREFCQLLDEARRRVLGLERSALALRIVQNALLPLTPELAPAILESQRMAARFLQLPIEAPAKPEAGRELHVCRVDLVERLAQYPTDVLTEHAETGVWPERAGLPPWEEEKS